MIKDSLNSILDNIKERTTNPFLGTLVVVWMIRNWELVYALFTFNSNSNLHSRLTYIKQHFEHQSFFCNMLIVVVITIVVLIFTYILLIISRFITDFYDKIAIPFISKITDKSSVVLKVEYVALQDVVKKLELRLEEERLAKVAAQNERDAADQKVLNNRTENSIGKLNEAQSDIISEKREEDKFTSISHESNISSTTTTDNQYISPEAAGTVKFDYSNNNGMYSIGHGEFLFELQWSKASNTSIHFYNDPSTIKTVALVKDVKEIRSIVDASLYDSSSRSRTPSVNQIVVAKNWNNYYAAIKIIDLKDDSRGDSDDEITFEYVIQTNLSTNFSV